MQKITKETYNKLSADFPPGYNGSVVADPPYYPERENGNMRSWEEVDRERQERFRRWLGPELYGWLNDHDTGEF